MPSEFDYLEEALERAIEEKRAHPTSSRVRAVINLAKIKKAEIETHLTEAQKRIEQANRAVAKEPALKPFVKAVFGDLARVKREHLNRLRDIGGIIRRAEEADE